MPAVLLAAAGSAQAGDRAELFERRYVSTAVLKDGERHPLFEETEIRVDLRHERDRDVITWQADCNDFGADVDVTATRLITGRLEGTSVGCPKARVRRDRWMARFFGADPKWRIPREERLKLTAGDRVIRLTSRRPGR